MRRLVIAGFVALALGLAACVPTKQPAPGTSYERLIAGYVNELRAQHGQAQVGWSNVKASEAAATAAYCDAINGGDAVDGSTFPACHSRDYDGEVLFFWPGSCAETAERAYRAVFGGPTVQGWLQTPPDLAYLTDYGTWPTAHSLGVAVRCDTTTRWGSGLYFVARLGH